MIGPIFVKGMSRSGGMLMTTILDCHPEIAMSYEIYPNLIGDDPEKFVVYAMRSGIGKDWIANVMTTMDNPYNIISNVGTFKSLHQGKKHWGCKLTGNYDEYLKHFPGCQFINVIRDGRDVLASQLNTGSFNPDPAELAKAWEQGHKVFTRRQLNNPSIYRSVFYEQLCKNPYKQIKKLCKWLKVDFDIRMLNPDKQDLTIHKTNHITGDRLKVPIDTTQIGRWKKELTNAQYNAFMDVAGESLRVMGYET